MKTWWVQRRVTLMRRKAEVILQWQKHRALCQLNCTGNEIAPPQDKPAEVELQLEPKKKLFLSAVQQMHFLKHERIDTGIPPVCQHSY